MRMTLLNPLPPPTQPAHPEAELREALAALRARFFDAEGATCRYAALAGSAEVEALAAAAGGLAGFDPKKLGIPQQVAFWINCYNALVLHAIAQAELGDSVRRAKGYFENWQYRIAGQAFSLDDIEHGVLRGNASRYGHLRTQFARGDPRIAYITLLADPRAHFGLHSACRASPPLRVFHGRAIEAELEAATRDYLRRTVQVSPDGAEVRVPMIFKWYAEDFGGEDDALDFVVSRIEDQATVERIDARLGRVSIAYLDYDWSLNVAAA